ncbi:MAG: ImmA/IrrE family metallo-endopeptidase [Pseudomonadota bacterium]
MGQKNKKQLIPNRRRLTILEVAQLKREKQAPFTSVFDPIKYIEQTLPKEIKGFDFDYWSEHPEFQKRPERRAFVHFAEDGTIELVVREEVMEGAYRGDNEYRFALAHEIGHVYLHRTKARNILSRHSVGSSDQYADDPILEYEANLFGGALIAPPMGIGVNSTLFDVRTRFRCSNDVANKALIDADFWRKQGK